MHIFGTLGHTSFFFFFLSKYLGDLDDVNVSSCVCRGFATASITLFAEEELKITRNVNFIGTFVECSGGHHISTFTLHNVNSSISDKVVH